MINIWLNLSLFEDLIQDLLLWQTGLCTAPVYNCNWTLFFYTGTIHLSCNKDRSFTDFNNVRLFASRMPSRQRIPAFNQSMSEKSLTLKKNV